MRCGGGADLVNADLVDRVTSDCELVSRRLSRDPYTGEEAQHESEVEPDSFTFGRTTVATFQVGRRFSGAADNIGFAVSADDGRTWRNGLLPGLTRVSVPPGANERASDPVVAYDAVNGVWLIGTLALEGQVTRLTVSRSRDGFTWGGPGHGHRGHGANGNRLRQELDRVRQRRLEPTSRPLLHRLHRRAPLRPSRGDHFDRRWCHVVGSGGNPRDRCGRCVPGDPPLG